MDEIDRRAYHDPSPLEMNFLRVVTHGYAELRRQIHSCRIADFDPEGWCYVLTLDGPRVSSKRLEGPTLLSDDLAVPPVETILLINGQGMLHIIEIIDYGRPLTNLYEAFVEAANAKPSGLMYLND